MKAAVLYNFGETPKYEDFPNPVLAEGEISIDVKAVTLENVDKMMADGSHFASKQFLNEFPAIIGKGGVGERADGRLVGFSGMRAPYGAMAEKVVVPENETVVIPNGIRPEVAAALPSAAMTSLLPLKWGTQMKKGATVLINGATGVAGKLAVQIAKLLGAKHVIGTGRNEESLKRIQELGADQIIDLKKSKKELIKSFKQETVNGIDIVLDFLWGEPTEALIQAMVPDSLHFTGARTQLVQIGEKAGAELTLSADSLRTSGLEIIGGASGLTAESILEASNIIWEWAKEEKLQMDIETVSLQDIESIWQRKDFQGTRIVITP